MGKFTVLDISTGQMQILSRGQLKAVLKKHRREAARVLKSSRAQHVVYGLQHDKLNYHIIPCITYADARYKACFKAGINVKPLAVHHK